MMEHFLYRPFFLNVQAGAAGGISVLFYLQRGDNTAGHSLQESQSVQVLQSNFPQSNSSGLCHYVQVQERNIKDY